MADLHEFHERIHLSDGDKAAAKKLINEAQRDNTSQEYSVNNRSIIPFGLIGTVSIIIIVVVIIISFVM